MHIILTHEQADFDALASLLGAYLLDDRAVPVLPRRMNRNVRAFLTLYGTDLPFVEARDLPAGPIEAVTLVDTQSMVSVRGMSETTRVRVIDHHPLPEQLPPDWLFTISGTGATTTMFVESLRERAFSLDIVKATLLLLGIYEDTGSLTYERTTARDLVAASYLLEQGASLAIASGFLNHPLSKAQQELYELLRKNVENYTIHGHTILITQCDAQEMDEELSTIAHKLRDYMEPDALCLLATTRGGVQMILRSMTGDVDVGEIADHFGGGGHERAAAALVKDRELAEVHAELVEILPRFVQPAFTVSRIMSAGPQLLAPDTSLKEAAERMQRYGYEGYPVVHEGKLVGLLTRRAVDRALSHKLNSTAAQLMEAGTHTIHPDDSIEHLQRLMTETGWGQIPVVSPEDGSIIGIVTRTDLIKTFTPKPRGGEPQNLADRLEKVLPPGRLALLKAVAHAAYEQDAALYIVGGFVRDLLLDRSSLDFDLVVEGDAITLARRLAQRYGGRVTSHTRFGTAKWFMKGGKFEGQVSTEELPTESLDLVSARTEFYSHPSALPTVERGSIKLDLHRRDFTINTLALRLDGRHYGELHDSWGGLADLRRGIVRVLHSLSFVDDPTRILRAVRFEQRFNFRIDERTLELLKDAASLLDRVSGDRIRHELDHILSENLAPKMIGRLNELGSLTAIHPGLVWDDWFRSRLENVAGNQIETVWQPVAGDAQTRVELIYVLWLLRLSPGHGREAIARLKFSAHLVRNIHAARRLWQERQYLTGSAPSLVVERLENLPELALQAVYIASDEPDVKDALLAYQTRWRMVMPTISGHDLRSSGLPPGPIYKEVLKSLRDAWLNGRVSNAQEESALLRELVRERGGEFEVKN